MNVSAVIRPASALADVRQPRPSATTTDRDPKRVAGRTPRGRRRPTKADDYLALNRLAAELILQTSGRGIALEWARSVLAASEPKIRGPLFKEAST